MTGGTLAAGGIVLCVCVLSVRSVVRRIRHGSSCCGEHEPPAKKVRVADRNKAHYPFACTLRVDGMHCANCTRRVENALNAEDGVWATADLAAKTVTVRAKRELLPRDMETLVSQAGYTVLSVEQEPLR